MAQKIYNNGSDGKILMSSAGKVIRQPYEFGNAFQNRMGLNNYIRISSVNIPNTIYVIYHINRKDIIGTPDIIPLNITDGVVTLNNYLALNATSTFYNSLRTTILNTLYNVNTSTPAPICLTYLSYTRDNTLKYIGVNLTYTTNNTVPSAILGDIVNFNLNSSDRYKIANFKVFNRNLSTSEISYCYNNATFSDLQSTAGIEINIPCNYAEILDFSTFQDGSDMRVGCRDYSGNNRHGQIMNLPAGPLSEQLAYANEYLFVPFLT